MRPDSGSAETNVVDTSAKHSAAGADAEVPAPAGAEEATGDTSVLSCIQSTRHILSSRIQHIIMPDLDLRKQRSNWSVLCRTGFLD